MQPHKKNAEHYHLAWFLNAITTANGNGMERREMSALEQKLWNNLKATNEMLCNKKVRPHQTLAWHTKDELVVVKAQNNRAMCAIGQEN